jgi:hypothetical protein
MTSENNLTDLLNDLIPKSIDNIIRDHRDEVCLRLVTDAEIAALPPIVLTMTELMPVKATITDYFVIRLDAKQKGEITIVVGTKEESGNLMYTSRVKSFDTKSNLLLTQNSLYRMGAKSDKEPSAFVLMHICCMLNKWGIGQSFGVPEFFY